MISGDRGSGDWVRYWRSDLGRLGSVEAMHAPAQAAATVGFADQAHLTRWFRRYYGLTPAAYRRASPPVTRPPVTRTPRLSPARAASGLRRLRPGRPPARRLRRTYAMVPPRT